MDRTEGRSPADPLVTIGAHTLSHCNLAKCTSEAAEHEIAASRGNIEAKLNRPVMHFAYPYGDKGAATARDFAIVRQLGFKTAVTTRPGNAVRRERCAHDGAAATVAERQLSG